MPAMEVFASLAVIPPVVFNAAGSAGMMFAVRNVSACTLRQFVGRLDPSHVRDTQQRVLLFVSKTEQPLRAADISIAFMQISV